MNEIWEIHKKVLVFLAITVIGGLIAWFAVGDSLYASMIKSSRSADKNYNDASKYFLNSTPIDEAKRQLADAIEKADGNLLKLKESIEMQFSDFINIPKDQKRTKLTYFDTMLFETRESMARKSMVNRTKIPQDIGWPDFIDVPHEEHDTVVPELLKKLSVTEKVLSLLISSKTTRKRVTEVKEIKVGDTYTEKVREGYPDFVKHYPITITFCAELPAINKFLDLIHYVDLKGSKRKVGQYFEIEYFSIRWDDVNPTHKLIVDMRLSALEFIEGAIEPEAPIEKAEPGDPQGF